ncbi:MAG: efflux RND transporter permease subunit [Clostridiales Family XIII bacterium]|nr:efflux RND transporter permease subunit [Clostridiales Family XIII bacterium]
MNISKIAVNRPVSAIMLMLIIVSFGLISFTKLPLDLFPKMELPMQVVIVNYPNAAPTEVESMVTRTMERQIATVENLSAMTSYSMDGMSIVLAEFVSGTDMNFAGLDMREKIDMIADYLPDTATKPMVISMNPSMLPISTIYVSGDMDLTELNRLVEDEVLPAIERTPGVASADSFGGRENEIRIEIDQEKLDGYHLTLGAIAQLLSAENISLPSGSVENGSREMIVRTVGDFKSIDDVKDVSIPLPTKETIKLGDVATVVEKEKVQTSIGRVNGEAAIGISITKQTVANTVQVSNRLDKVLDDLKEKHPNLSISVVMNQADFVNESILFVAESAILGCLFAVLICLLFLRSFSSTLIIALSIPTSIIATFILMYAMGLSMNMLSLSGLAVGIGMLVDDSIVVMENIFRHRGDGLPPKDAAILGTREVTMPVISATITKIAVFLPIVFVEGMAATIFKEFSFTIGFALICSLIVALTVIPMLCSRLLNTEELEDKIHLRGRVYRLRPLEAFGRGIDRLIELYTRIVKFSLGHRKTVVWLCVLLLAVSSALVGIVGGELLPSTDEGAIDITAEVPAGTSLEQTDEIIRQIEDYVANNVDGLESYSVSVGGSSLISLGSSSGSTVSLALVDKNKRDLSAKEVAAKISEDLSGIVGAKIDVSATSQMSMSLGGGGISISISGDDFAVLEEIDTDFIAIIDGINGTTNVSGSLEEGNPEVRVIPNRNLASAYGITTYQIAQAMNTSLSGARTTSLKRDGAETDIVISLNGEYGDSIENMKQISIMTQAGQIVHVGDIADVTIANSPSSIERHDQVRMISVTAEPTGRDLQSVTADIEKELTKYRMPTGYTYEIGGEAQELEENFTDLIYALLLSILIIFMILASQFESLIQPLIIMLAIPFALTGAFLAMFLTNTPLSIVGFLGIIMLSGIVVNNSILLIDFINQNRNTYGTRNEAVVAAGRFRFRPIIMTALTTCLGLLPMAIGFGSGGELIQPMGITVIGGLLFSTVVTLVLIPVIYSIVDDAGLRRRAKRAAKKQKRLEMIANAGVN